MKCLILAAGYATRLYPLTENFPKPLLKVGEKTILDWLVDDIDTAGLNQTKFLDGAACPQDRLILFIRLFMGIQAGKQMRDFLFPDAVEQIGVGQKHFIHNILHLLS